MKFRWRILNECGLKLTCLALFVNSAAARRMSVTAIAVRRSEKARFLFIMTGLIGEVCNEFKREQRRRRKRRAQIHT